jgi:membrane protein DedA with SNARE-associated domain/rhodanese-related sulfurtransferase
MNETVQFIARHGYWLLVLAVVGRQACLPIPTNLLLLAAGALAHSGALSLIGILGLTVSTFLLADLAWYEAGRRSGGRILHFVCGLTRDPEACVKKASDVPNSHRLRNLLFSKFIVGLDAVAAPAAGAAAIPRLNFLVFDAFGATLWTTCYALLGYLFSNQLDRVATHVMRMGEYTAIAVVMGFSFYILRRLIRWRRFVSQFTLARITPEELRHKLNVGEDVLIVDLQGRADHTAQPMAIPGAVRIDPRRLERFKDVWVSPSREVVLYCATPDEFTSARVALALRQKGVDHVHPLAGGLQGWLDQGFPVTAEVRTPSGGQLNSA